MYNVQDIFFEIWHFVGTLPETNIAPWRLVVGKLLSFWEGAMLVYQSVSIVFVNFRGGCNDLYHVPYYSPIPSMYGTFTNTILYIYHKNQLNSGKYTTTPWFYDTEKGGQSNNDTEVTAVTKLSKWLWPMPARWIPSRQQLQGVHDGRGQGECGAGDTPVTWRRGWM